ncbi:MAG: LamG-like jellyroll fold domain-containing protein, partial [Sedimentisphaerales bacterium]|nr:LamG-like jellyroll fold domain-containing protein [Sedimentisphaerales bacterium]
MKRLSFWFLIVTLTLQVQAAVPEPTGVWEFNAPNPISAAVGAPLELIGSALNVTGVSDEDGAMAIGEGSYFICTHGIAPNGGGAKVNEWTLLIDFSFPPSSLSDPPNGYNDLFQTDPTNASDADWTINSSGAIGIGAVGYSGASGFTTKADTWYRMVVVVDNGVRHDIYVDGVEIFKGNQQGIDGRFSLDDTLLLFAAGNNQDGDDAPINVSTVAIWDVPLTSDEILILGNAGQSSFGNNPQAAGPVPADGALHDDTWLNITWRAGDYAVSHDVYLGDNFDDVDAGAESTFRGNQTDAFLVAGFPGFAYPDGLVPGTTYYWRIDEVNDAEPNSPWKGDVWSFMIPPKKAYIPDPADGAESVGVDDSLKWTPGFGAKLHHVYFGETFDEVDNAAGALPQGSATYSPGTLKMANT